LDMHPDGVRMSYVDRRIGPQGLAKGGDRVADLKQEARELPARDLTHRQLWDIELLLSGAFHPLKGFLVEADYEGVCRSMRLADGRLWPIPVTLDVTEAFAEKLAPGGRLALLHPEGMVLAILTVRDLWTPDRKAEAEAVFGTGDEGHPGVFHLLHETNPVYVGGELEGVELPPHHTFKEYRHTPAQLREELDRREWGRVVAFQTRNPMHRAHVELTKRAAEQADAGVLLHPVVGRTSPGDIDYFCRVRCYRAVLNQYPGGTAMLSLLPLAMRMAGPREALWHALIRKNYGATHFIVGRDHAGPRNPRTGDPYYEPYAAQELTRMHQEEIGITILPFEEMVYAVPSSSDASHLTPPTLQGIYVPRSQVPAGSEVLALSGTDFRRRLQTGEEIPDWFSFPEVITELRRSYPPRSKQGFTVFFTGLSGAGKSTIAQVLMAKLMEIGGRPVSLLDGDIVRKNLSSELGFSKEHRDLNIQRIGFVAGEITKNRGVAICAPIAPYAATRRKVRELIEQYGGFIEVYVSTPLEVCEQRDRKGLYAKARAGLITGFTGIDDPYEAPEYPELTVDASEVCPEEAAGRILGFLTMTGYLERAQCKEA